MDVIKIQSVHATPAFHHSTVIRGSRHHCPSCLPNLQILFYKNLGIKWYNNYAPGETAVRQKLVKTAIFYLLWLAQPPKK